MSFSDWLQQPATRRLINIAVWIVAVFIGGFVLGASIYSRYDHQDAPASKHSQSNVHLQERGPKSAPAAKAAQGEPDSERKEWREEETLKAQINQAEWAFWTMIAAFAGIGLSVVGVLLIKRTLDATWRAVQEAEKGSLAAERAVEANMEANRINRESFIADKRAWLSIEDVHFLHPTRFGEDAFVLRVRAKIKNHGPTPAKSVWVGFESFYSQENSETYLQAKERIIAKARKHWEELGDTVFPGDEYIVSELWADAKDRVAQSISTRPSGERKGGVMVFITVSYRVFGDPTTHITQQVYGLLNVPIGTLVVEGGRLDLPQQPFMSGVID